MKNYHQSKMISCLALMIVVISLCTENCKSSSVCNNNVQLSYLNDSMYMIAKVQYDFSGTPKDCSDILNMGYHKSGVYTVWPVSRILDGKEVEVYCDMETSGGGWTVIQRRGNYGNPKDYFYRDWSSYKEGFGDVETEFWLGNDNIFALTNQKLCSARFHLVDAKGNSAYAQYDTFWIDNEDNKYMLHISGYSGTAGDSLGSYHHNKKFTTKDQKNDQHRTENCAEQFQGAWWYYDCHNSNLNGLYVEGKQQSQGKGIIWKSWKGYQESLQFTEIKIRPKNFKLAPTSSEIPN